MNRRRRALAWVLGLAACTDEAPVTPVAGQPPAVGGCSADGGDFVACVDAFAPAPGVSYGHDAMPEVVLGPPVAATTGAGSTDVASLGCGGTITLEFTGGIADGPDDDLIVFENAFSYGAGTFVEPAQVLVSDDGTTWFAFDCAFDEAAADGCAGVTPTLAADAAAAIDPQRAGGDAFDLDELGLERVRWVRLVDRTREHHGEMWCSGAAGGFDLDAIARVHAP